MMRSMGDIQKDRVRAVFDTHGAWIRRTLLQLHIPLSDVDDVEQEVRWVVARKLDLWAPKKPGDAGRDLRRWLYEISSRAARYYRRKAAKRAEMLLPNDELEHEPARALIAEGQLEEQERQMLLFELLAGLAPELRAVVMAYELEGQEMRETARMLAIPVNTAWNRRRRAMLGLRAGLLRRLAVEKAGARGVSTNDVLTRARARRRAV